MKKETLEELEAKRYALMLEIYRTSPFSEKRKQLEDEEIEIARQINEILIKE